MEEPADSIKFENTTSDAVLQNLEPETNIAKLLCQGWVMEDDLEALDNNDEPQGIYPVRSFYLFEDFTFVKNVRNYMEHGKWSYDEDAKKIVLKSSGGSRDEYKIAAIGANDLVVINSGINSVTKLNFVADARKYRNKKDDPFYIDNNLWRIPPDGAETDEQLKQRLKDYLHFHILFYRDNLERHAKTISFYGFPGCIKWYAGGIYMIKEEELADNWYECFYSKPQAIKAYKMMSDVVGKKYKWEKGNASWVKKNLQVLEQMYAALQ